jgi:hypothetical protein
VQLWDGVFYVCCGWYAKRRGGWKIKVTRNHDATGECRLVGLRDIVSRKEA